MRDLIQRGNWLRLNVLNLYIKNVIYILVHFNALFAKLVMLSFESFKGARNVI